MVQVLQAHSSLSARKEESHEMMPLSFLPYAGINPVCQCCEKPQAQLQRLLQNTWSGHDFSSELAMPANTFLPLL